MLPSREFVPLAVVAKKWCRPEGDLLDWASQQKFYIYYFQNNPKIGTGWRIVRKELGCFLRGDDSVSCSEFPVPIRIPLRPMNPMVPFTVNNHLPAGFVTFSSTDFIENSAWPITIEYDQPTQFFVNFNESMPFFYFPAHPDVTVNKTDLFLHHDEIADMEARYPQLAKRKSEIETNPKLEEPKIAREADTKIETSNISIIDEPVDILLSHNDPEQLFPPNPDSESVATLDSRLPLSQKIDKENDLIAQAEKPDGIKKPPKKKVRSDQLTVKAGPEVIETIPRVDDENEQQPSSFQAAPDEIYLTLNDIIGNKKKGIHGIIPMSKTKWYDGIKAGIFPDQIRLGLRSVVWKKSDILALLKRMEKGELGVGIKV